MPLDETMRPPRFAVIGAGFAGLTAAIKLMHEGAEVTVFERSDGVGGVWRANHYPGAACDVPSFLYSWSFAPKHDWSRRFAPQAEILEYIERTVDELGVRDRIRTGHDLRAMTWSDETGDWTLDFADGRFATADFVVAALGQMSVPAVPSIPGAERFEGTSFHTADWRHDVELDHRDVVVIGAGASALQVVPAIADSVRTLSIVQRSPGYVLAKGDEEHDRPPTPLGSRIARYAAYLSKELKTPRLVRWPRLVARAEAAFRRDLRAEVANPELLEKVEPDDRYGCKRILVSNDWYRTLQRPDVHLHDGVVAEIRSRSVLLRDGSEVPADVIIYGTGFHASSFLHGIDVSGVGGRMLETAWRRTPSAYLGMTVPGMPNLFLMYGPNTNPAWNSVLVMLECQVRYIVSAARRWRRRGAFSMEVNPEAAQRFADQLRTRSARSVWVTGCQNWFTTADGTNTQNWPALVTEYWLRTRRVRWSDYTIRARAGLSRVAERLSRSTLGSLNGSVAERGRRQETGDRPPGLHDVAASRLP
ncbi:MAG: NAD(P)/FAD-dependent oxidoreductase [Salinibacterium sp.]|nr:NAD(P)/FAD-dependent oxidoreductase [Salinibacterium sp.]